MAKVVCVAVIHYGGKKGTETTILNRVYDSRDKIVKASPTSFLGLDEWSALNDRSTLIEATTAVPNESRNVKKPAAKKRTRKPAAKKSRRKAAAKKA